MLRVHGLACDRGDRRLFSDVDFSVATGEWLQIEGANGAGKTSLLRILAGLAPAAGGQIEWDKQPVSKVRDEFHARLLYLGHAATIKDDLSALENLQTAAAVAGSPLEESVALQALRRIGLKGAKICPAGYCRRARSAALRWPACCAARHACGSSTNPSSPSTWRRSTFCAASSTSTSPAAACCCSPATRPCIWPAPGPA